MARRRAKATNGSTNGSNGHAEPEYDEATLARAARGTVLDDDGTEAEEAPVLTATPDEVRDAAAALTADRSAVDPDEERLPTRYLRHELTVDEIDAMRAEREKGDAEREKLDGELVDLTARAKACKTQIEALDLKGRALSKTIRDGHEYRDIECREEKGWDYREGSTTGRKVGMRVFRCDTEEMIDWLELRADERQVTLFGDASAQA